MNPATSQDRRGDRASRERGVILLWFAFFLMVMVGFVALGIDGAKMAATKVELQNAADAAALAGASAVSTSPGSQGELAQALARARAQETGRLNRAFVGGPQPVEIDAADISFPTRTQIRVVARRSKAAGNGMTTSFARALGHPTVDLAAAAVAEAMPVNSVCEDLVPMGAVPPDEDDFQTGCDHIYDLKLGGGGGSNGNYNLLSFPECPEGVCAGMGERGANTMRCLVANGYGCCLEIDQQADTEPGNESGPFKQGAEQRWDRDTDQRENICYSDYRGNGERVVYVPKITPPGHGRSRVTIIGFTAFFMRARPGNGIQSIMRGEFLHDVVPGGGLTSPTSNGTTLYTLKLVR